MNAVVRSIPVVLSAATSAACSHGSSERVGTTEAPRPESSAVKSEITASPSGKEAAALEDPVKRGERLVHLGGCGDCHTPMKLDPKIGMPVPDRTRWLSGHPENAPEPKGKPGEGDQGVIGATFTSFKLPFGTVYAANLTPDPETGIGKLTEAEFIATLRTGHKKGTERPLLPPMPWQNLAGLPEEDLKAMYAYLRSLLPIENRVPEPRVPGEAIAAVARSYQRAKDLAR